MRRRFKTTLLCVSLFLFLLVVVGGGLRLNPAGALVAAATGTPLLIYVFNRWNASLDIKAMQTVSADFRCLNRSNQPCAGSPSTVQGHDSSRQ